MCRRPGRILKAQPWRRSPLSALQRIHPASSSKPMLRLRAKLKVQSQRRISEFVDHRPLTADCDVHVYQFVHRRFPQTLVHFSTIRAGWADLHMDRRGPEHIQHGEGESQTAQMHVASPPRADLQCQQRPLWVSCWASRTSIVVRLERTSFQLALSILKNRSRYQNKVRSSDCSA